MSWKAVHISAISGIVQAVYINMQTRFVSIPCNNLFRQTTKNTSKHCITRPLWGKSIGRHGDVSQRARVTNFNWYKWISTCGDSDSWWHIWISNRKQCGKYDWNGITSLFTYICLFTTPFLLMAYWSYFVQNSRFFDLDIHQHKWATAVWHQTAVCVLEMNTLMGHHQPITPLKGS